MRRNGFGLVEVTVALTLLAVGLLGVAASGLVAARLLRESHLAELAAFEAGQVLDSLAQVPNPQAGQRRTGAIALSWSVAPATGAGASIALIVTYQTGAGLRTEQFSLDVKK